MRLIKSGPPVHPAAFCSAGTPSRCTTRSPPWSRSATATLPPGCDAPVILAAATTAIRPFAAPSCPSVCGVLVADGHHHRIGRLGRSVSAPRHHYCSPSKKMKQNAHHAHHQWMEGAGRGSGSLASLLRLPLALLARSTSPREEGVGGRARCSACRQTRSACWRWGS